MYRQCLRVGEERGGREIISLLSTVSQGTSTGQCVVLRTYYVWIELSQQALLSTNSPKTSLGMSMQWR